MLPVSLDCPFSIAPSIFFNVYLKSPIQKIYGLHHWRVDRSEIFICQTTMKLFFLWRFPPLLKKFRSRFVFSSLNKCYLWDYGILYKICVCNDNCTISKRICFVKEMDELSLSENSRYNALIPVTYHSPNMNPIEHILKSTNAILMN